MKKDQQFKEEILKLINKKQEGGYWDFKLKWHDNNIDLLHDILCMANNLENRDAYIIFGVKDKDFSIKGVDTNDKNRKNTNDIVLFYEVSLLLVIKDRWLGVRRFPSGAKSLIF